MTFPTAGQPPGQAPTQQGSDQGQGPGTGDQQQAQQGNQQGQGLLDAVAQQNQGQQGAQQDSGQMQGQGKTNGADYIITELEQRLATRFDAVADRRVNALLNEIRSRNQGQQQGNQGQQGGQGDQQRDQHGRSTPSGPDPAAVREGRSAFREYLGDRLQFVSQDEREFAVDLGSGLVASRIASGGEPDSVGREVATTVADRIRRLRAHYEDQILGALKARGVDVTSGGRGGGSAPQGVTAPFDATEAARRAAATLAQQVNTERGWAQPAKQ